MKTRLLKISLALIVAGTMIVACGDKKADDAKAPADEKKEGKKEGPAAEKKEEGGAGMSAACKAATKCCGDFADMLAGLQGMPAAAVDQARGTCNKLGTIEGDKGDQFCNTNTAEIVRTAEGMAGMPGFTLPDSCK